MKINVGLNEENKHLLFITNDEDENIAELEVTEGYFHHCLKEFGAGEYNMGLVSDGYHTFDELYFHRMILFAVICNSNKDLAWKSWKHHDGTMYDDYFIVGINTPEGQYTYHYHKSKWDYFKVKELENAPEWDGHTPEYIIRLLSLVKEEENNVDC